MNDDLISQVFGFVSQNAAAGGQSTGQVAEWLIGAGLSAAAITQILNSVAYSAAATPAQINYVKDELRYMQDSYYGQQRWSWVLPVAVIGGLLWLASRKN